MEVAGSDAASALIIERKGKELPVVTRTNNLSIRYCDKCKCVKPDRAHHCGVCQTCVLKMDHHCIYNIIIILIIIIVIISWII
jgi:hypothetical protein